MPSSGTFSIGTNGRDYSTISAWEADTDVSLTGMVVGECYNDSVFDEEVTIDGASNLSSSQHRRLTVAEGERHDGTEGTGARVSYSGSNDAVIYVGFGEDYCVVDWLEITVGSQNMRWIVGAEASNVEFHHLIIHDAQVGDIDATAVWFDRGVNGLATNCIVYGLTGGDSGPIAFYGGSGETFHNCVAYDLTEAVGEGQGGLGFASHFSDSPTVTNCVAVSCVTAGFESDVSTTDCASDDGTGTGISADASDFADATGSPPDFHLASGSNLIDAGTDLGDVPAKIDIDGGDRHADGGAWDIGADEFDLPVTEIVVTVGLATETDVAQPVGAAKSEAVGQASEQDTAFAIGRSKTRSVARADESDVAFALGRRKGAAVGLATEVDDALAVARSKRQALGRADEQDLALAVNSQLINRKTVGLATEQDVAFALDRRKARSVGQALEQDVAFGVNTLRPVGLGLAVEQDVARPVGRTKRVTIGRADEQDVAFPVAFVTPVAVGLATETDTGLGVTWRKLYAVGLATETDIALPVTWLTDNYARASQIIEEVVWENHGGQATVGQEILEVVRDTGSLDEPIDTRVSHALLEVIIPCPTPNLHPYGFYFGTAANNEIIESGRGIDDAGAAYGLQARLNPIAAGGVGGEALYRNLYLTIAYTSGFDLDVVPVLDGERIIGAKDRITGHASCGGRVDEFEIALKQPFERGGEEQWRYGLRGTWLTADLENLALSERSGFVELENVDVEVERVRENLQNRSFATLPLDDEPTPDPGFYLGASGADNLYEFGPGTDDAGTDITPRFRSNRIAPAGDDAEHIFTNLYLAFTRNNPTDLTIEVVGIVDGEELTTDTITLPGTESPVTDAHEVPLHVPRDGTSQGAPRGVYFQYELRAASPLPDGRVVLESAEVEAEQVRESHPALQFYDTPLGGTPLPPGGQFYFGPSGGADLKQFGTAGDDDGEPIMGRTRSRKVAPEGPMGECVFNNLYLVFTHRNDAEFTFRVNVIVDNRDVTVHYITLPAVTDTETHVEEVPIIYEAPGGHTHRGRGTWISYLVLGVEANDRRLTLEGSVVEYEPVRESEASADAGT